MGNEVEVSFNALDRLYSIDVTESRAVQSVAAAPSGVVATRNNGANYKKKALKLPFGTSPTRMSTDVKCSRDNDATIRRNSRFPIRDTAVDRSRQRRGPSDSHSCPPPISRDMTASTCLMDRIREHSCPPPKHRDSASSSLLPEIRNNRQNLNLAVEVGRSMKGENHVNTRTKDLVANVSKKCRQRSFFRRLKQTSNGKVVPAPH